MEKLILSSSWKDRGSVKLPRIYGDKEYAEMHNLLEKKLEMSKETPISNDIIKIVLRALIFPIF